MKKTVRHQKAEPPPEPKEESKSPAATTRTTRSPVRNNAAYLRKRGSKLLDPSTYPDRPSTSDFARRPTTYLRLWIVMQGESRADKEGVIDGWNDSYKLTEVGKVQATLVGKRLAAIPFARVYTSDLIRAKQTAHLILTPNVHKDAIQAQPKRPGLKAPPNAHKTRIDARLRDASAGVRETRHAALSLAACTRMAAEEAGVSVEKFVPPHVETGEEVAARAQDFLSTLLQEFDYLDLHCSTSLRPPDPLNILLVTHQGFVQNLYKGVFKVSSPPQFRHGSLSRADIGHVIHDCHVGKLTIYSRTMGYDVRYTNDIKHVDNNQPLLDAAAAAVTPTVTSGSSGSVGSGGKSNGSSKTPSTKTGVSGKEKEKSPPRKGDNGLGNLVNNVVGSREEKGEGKGEGRGEEKGEGRRDDASFASTVETADHHTLPTMS